MLGNTFKTSKAKVKKVLSYIADNQKYIKFAIFATKIDHLFRDIWTLSWFPRVQKHWPQYPFFFVDLILWSIALEFEKSPLEQTFFDTKYQQSNEWMSRKSQVR